MDAVRPAHPQQLAPEAARAHACAAQPLLPIIERLKQLIETDALVYQLFHQMFTQVPHKRICTSIMAGKAATNDNVVLLSRNDDFTRNNWNKYLAHRRVPEYQVNDGNTVSAGRWVLGNGLSVPVPKLGYAYSAMSNSAAYAETSQAIGDRHFFEERSINAKNVAMSATNSLAMNDSASAGDPLLPRAGIA